MSNYSQVKIRITGIQPLMINNVQTANPLNPWAKLLKEQTSKRGKTDDVQLEIIRLQFMASWYVNAEGQYYLPSECLFRSIEEGAKEFKAGKKFVENVQIIEDELIIDFDGKNKSLEELYDGGNGKNVDTRLCAVGIGAKKSKVTATRAIIDKWKLTATLIYDSEQIQLEDIIRAAENAGARKAIGTYRRRYGRYKVEILK